MTRPTRMVQSGVGTRKVPMMEPGEVAVEKRDSKGRFNRKLGILWGVLPKLIHSVVVPKLIQTVQLQHKLAGATSSTLKTIRRTNAAEKYDARRPKIIWRLPQEV